MTDTPGEGGTEFQPTVVLADAISLLSKHFSKLFVIGVVLALATYLLPSEPFWIVLPAGIIVMAVAIVASMYVIQAGSMDKGLSYEDIAHLLWAPEFRKPVTTAGMLLIAQGAFLFVPILIVFAISSESTQSAVNPMAAYFDFIPIFGIFAGMVFFIFTFVAAPVAVLERRGFIGAIERSLRLSKNIRIRIFGLFFLVLLANILLSVVTYSPASVVATVGATEALVTIPSDALALSFDVSVVMSAYYNLVGRDDPTFSDS